MDRRRALASEPGFRVACALCPLCWPAVTRWPRRISRLERDGRPARQCPTAWLWRGDEHWGCSLHGARGAPGPALPQGCCALFHPLGSRGRVGPEEGGLQLQSSPGPTHGVPPPEQGVRGVRHAVAVGTRRLCPEIADCWGWGRGPPAACPRSLAFPCPPQGGSVPWDCGPVSWPRPCGLGCPLALGVLFSCARALGGFTTGPASLVEPGDPQDRGAPPSLRAPVVRASPTQNCGSFGVLVGAALGELAALFARSFPSVRHVPGLAADTCGTRSQALGAAVRRTCRAAVTRRTPGGDRSQGRAVLAREGEGARRCAAAGSPSCSGAEAAGGGRGGALQGRGCPSWPLSPQGFLGWAVWALLLWSQGRWAERQRRLPCKPAVPQPQAPGSRRLCTCSSGRVPRAHLRSSARGLASGAAAAFPAPEAPLWVRTHVP